MYAEIDRAARLHAQRYWPLPEETDRGWLERELLGAGWRREGGSYLKPAPVGEETFQVLYGPETGTVSRWQTVAAIAGLTALSAANIPLRQSIRLILPERSEFPDGCLHLAPPAGDGAEIAAESGLLLLLASDEADGLIRVPCWPLLIRARNSLENAGFAPQVALRPGSGGEGLGFVAPGRPGGGREEMARAAAACAGLLYGLAGYGVMAFDFDLAF